MKAKTFALMTAAVLIVTAYSPAAQAGCGSHGCAPKAELPRENRLSIVETAAAAGSFNTLVAAAKAAGLVETLSGPGPFTVFAPTDEAFARLPEGTVETLLKNPKKLAMILTYHVVPGTVKAAEVVELNSAKTVHGANVSITADKRGVMVDNANVIKTDILCSNGIIHVIDAVIMPKNIVETAASAGSFSTLLAAVEAAGLVETLTGDGPFTVFAPTDDAFAKLPKGAIESLLQDKEKLAAVLKYHVVPGKVLAADVKDINSAVTVQGQPVEFSTGSGVRVNNARVIAPDVVAANGVIHAIDNVLLPN